MANKKQNMIVARQEEWNKVLQDLDSENLKLMSYDNTLVPLLGDVRDKNILDYGAGPGVLALALSRHGADVKVWDINPDMREKAAKKIGKENVYASLEEIHRNAFDFLICNLVLCIVPEHEVRNIVKNIASLLNESGNVFIGFCNPKIFNVPESNLDLRYPTGNSYEENHDYKKIKKEGGYQIIESHRPIEWYEHLYADSGLKMIKEYFTPAYELKGHTIRDFIIFQLHRA